MIKVIAAIKRRHDLTHDQFREYYENEHMPLVLRYVSEFIVKYERSYIKTAMTPSVDPSNAFLDDWSGQYDCFMEVTLRDRDAHERMLAKTGTPEVSSLFANDEENFIDREATKVFICETVETDARQLG
jgi:hypothetical protein